MLSKDVKYKDFNGIDQVETIYFHLSMTELVGNQELVEEFESFQTKWNEMQQEDGEVTREGRQFLVDVVKRLMKLSYGEKADDGKTFRKSEEIWENFTQTLVYDEFFWGLFQPDPFACLEFLMALFPEEYMSDPAAKIAQLKNEASLPDDPSIPEGAVAPPVVTPHSGFVKEAAPKKPQDMTREELIEAMRLKNQA